jgi:hypothetical protein
MGFNSGLKGLKMSHYNHTDTHINLTPGRRVIREKLTVPQEVKNFPHFTELNIHCRVHKSLPLFLTLN